MPGSDYGPRGRDLTLIHLEKKVKSSQYRASFPYWIRIEAWARCMVLCGLGQSNRHGVHQRALTGAWAQLFCLSEARKDGRACLAVGKCSIRGCELMQQGQRRPLSLAHIVGFFFQRGLLSYISVLAFASSGMWAFRIWKQPARFSVVES